MGRNATQAHTWWDGGGRYLTQTEADEAPDVGEVGVRPDANFFLLMDAEEVQRIRDLGGK